jgi:hypothetical protein
VAIYFFKDRHEFEYLIRVTALDETHDLLVDENGDDYYFLYTEDDTIIQEIQFPIMNDNKYYQPQYFLTDGDDIYVEFNYNEVGEIEEDKALYRIDLQRHRLTEVLSYTASDIENATELSGDTYVSGNLFIEDGTIKALVQTYYDTIYRFYIVDFQDGKPVIEGEGTALETRAAGTIFYSEDGFVSLSWKNTLLRIDSNVQFESADAYYRLYPLGDGIFAGRNMTTGNIDRIDSKTNMVCTYDEALEQQLAQYSIRVTDIRDIGAYGSRTLLSLYDENGASLLTYEDGQLTVNHTFYHMRVLQMILLYLGIQLATFIIVVLAILFYKKLFRRFMIVKIAAILAVLIILCDGIAYIVILQLMTSQNDQSLINTLEQKAWQYDTLGLVPDVEDFADEVDVLSMALQLGARELAEMVDSLNLEVYYYGREHEGEDSLIVITYDRGCVGTEEEGIILQTTAEDMLRMEEEFVSCNTYSPSGKYGCYLFYPTRNTSGNINGCYIVAASRMEIESQTDSFMLQVIHNVLLMSVVIAALTLMIIGVLLNPLLKLRKKAERTFNSGVYEKEKEKSKDKTYLNELDLINAYFAEMTENVSQNMEEISKLRESNKIYFSERILESFGRKDITQVNFKENITETFYVIYGKLPEYYDDFRHLEKLIQGLLVQIKLYQGFVGELFGNHMLLCSKNPDFENVMHYLGHENGEIQAVFDKAPVHISVISQGDSHTFSVTLMEKDRQKRLEGYHSLVKAALLGTGRAVRNVRATSLCCVGCVQEDEYIYEMNGTNQNRKKLIRSLMQEAVKLYNHKNYVQARFLFARVLIKNPGNPAAAYYIRSIEQRKKEK